MQLVDLFPRLTMTTRFRGSMDKSHITIACKPPVNATSSVGDLVTSDSIHWMYSNFDPSTCNQPRYRVYRAKHAYKFTKKQGGINTRGKDGV